MLESTRTTCSHGSWWRVIAPRAGAKLATARGELLHGQPGCAHARPISRARARCGTSARLAFRVSVGDGLAAGVVSGHRTRAAVSRPERAERDEHAAATGRARRRRARPGRVACGAAQPQGQRLGLRSGGPGRAEAHSRARISSTRPWVASSRRTAASEHPDRVRSLISRSRWKCQESGGLRPTSEQ